MTSESNSSPQRRPTIRDVAREAGVSYATVSRVLNQHRWVGAESARAVREAIARTGYTANEHARSLATGRSGSVAFLLTEPHQSLFDDPNFAVLVRGAAQELTARHLALILMIASTPDERQQALDYFRGGHVDAVLVVSSHSGDPLLPQLARLDVQTVSCGRVMGLENVMSSVAADDEGGARSAVAHLVSSGRSRIATITGPQDTSGGFDRLRGYVVGLERHGLPRDDTLIVHGDWSSASGRAGMATLLAGDPALDGVFVANDRMAAGALTALRDAGRRVPDDVALIGVDDSGLAAHLDPSLTTVRLPLGLISREMVRLVCDRRDDPTPISITVPTSLVVRESAPLES